MALENKNNGDSLPEINEEYIQKMYGDLPKKNVAVIIKAMKKYDNNRWWESTDPQHVAMFQIIEDILMVDFSLFHQGIEELLGRPVSNHELSLNKQGIQEEIGRALYRKKIKMGVSEEQIQESVRRSIKMLEDFCQENNVNLIRFESEPEELDENGIDTSGYDGWL